MLTSSPFTPRLFQIRTHLLLPWRLGGIFVGVVQPHLTECYCFWVTHGPQDAPLMDPWVVFGKVGVAPKSPPHHVFRQQTFPEGLLHHESRVAEVGDATFEVWREAALVALSEVSEGPAKAKLPVEHVQVAVGVYKTHVCAHTRVTALHTFHPYRESGFISVPTRKGVAGVLQVSVGKSAQRGINIPRFVPRCFWSSCFWRIRRPRRRCRGTHQAVTGEVTVVSFCSASSCRGLVLTACLSKHRVLNRRPGGGTSRHQENALKKTGQLFNLYFLTKVSIIYTEGLPVRRQGFENLSWKASSTSFCDCGAHFHWEPLLFPLECPDSVHTGLCVLWSHWGTQGLNIHLVTCLCKHWFLPRRLSPTEALVRGLQSPSPWT